MSLNRSISQSGSTAAVLSGGDLWAAEITAAIRSCTAMALVCTPASVTSRNVRQEIQLAWDTDRPIVPLMLETVTFPDEIAYFLQGRQWIEVPDIASGSWTSELARMLPRPQPGEETPVREAPRSRRLASFLPEPATPILGRET